MKRIVYTTRSGGVAIVTPIRRISPGVEFTEEQAIARARAKLPADATNVRLIEESAIPADRTFRNAWRDTGVISCDMIAARAIHRDRLRALRKLKMEFWDGEWMKATAAGDAIAASAAEAKRQELRDVPQHPGIDAATTPDALKAVYPECLLTGS